MNGTSQQNLTQWTFFKHSNLYQNVSFFGRSPPQFISIIVRLFSRFEHQWFHREQSSVSRQSSDQSVAVRSGFFLSFCQQFQCLEFRDQSTSKQWFLFDQDGIQDCSLYIRSSDPSKRLLIAFSVSLNFTVRLPSSEGSSSSLELLVSVRDTRSCVTEWNLTSISVQPDSNAIGNLLTDLQGSSNALTSNPLVQLLAGGNQNTIGQVTSSLSQQFNQMNSDKRQSAVSSNSSSCELNPEIERSLGGIPATSISVSSLGRARSARVEITLSFLHLSWLMMIRSPLCWIPLHWIFSRNNWTVKRPLRNIWLDSPLRFWSPVQTRFSFKRNP